MSVYPLLQLEGQGAFLRKNEGRLGCVMRVRERIESNPPLSSTIEGQMKSTKRPKYLFLIVIKHNWKKRRTKRTWAGKYHIMGRANDTSHDGSKKISKWQWARTMLHAKLWECLFKINLIKRSRKQRNWKTSRFQLESSQISHCHEKGSTGFDNSHKGCQVSSGNIWWVQRFADQEVTASKAQSPAATFLLHGLPLGTKKWGKWDMSICDEKSNESKWK